ncbi:hypothetical protein GCM10010994_14850 [Chelatococcus reniformis]|uniref:DUF2155 domain-containing protein n=1 Tax=Chelatococcus reniformis TaxID=1494448 RepID=A0A916U1W7_9HYPH|nr:hypothetical protein GCM10010994_14850 [Chelatococcus reniformis]
MPFRRHPPLVEVRARHRTGACVLALLLALVAGVGGAKADRIKNPTAVFSGLDKITGRIISFEVAVSETVQFGALQLTPRVCYTRPETETPNTTAFVEVDEVTFQNEHKRIFEGWMFASSPGLHGIEHPVYDVWLIDCKGGKEVITEPRELTPAEEALRRDSPPPANAQPQPRNTRRAPPANQPRPRRIEPEVPPEMREGAPDAQPPPLELNPNRE